MLMLVLTSVLIIMPLLILKLIVVHADVLAATCASSSKPGSFGFAFSPGVGQDLLRRAAMQRPRSRRDPTVGGGAAGSAPPPPRRQWKTRPGLFEAFLAFKKAVFCFGFASWLLDG